MGNKKIELSATPAEVIVNLETEKENIMETKKIEVTRDAVVALAKEMNSILLDCKIQVDKQYTKDVIIGQVLSHADEMLYTDFILADENDKRVIFSTEAQETLVSLGQVIPQPSTQKTTRATRGAAAKKEKVEKFTRHVAVLQVIDNLPIEGSTFDVIQKEIDDLMVSKGHASVKANSCDQIVRFSLETLIHHKIVSVETIDKKKVYKLVTPPEAV